MLFLVIHDDKLNIFGSWTVCWLLTLCALVVEAAMLTSCMFTAGGEATQWQLLSSLLVCMQQERRKWESAGRCQMIFPPAAAAECGQQQQQRWLLRTALTRRRLNVLSVSFFLCSPRLRCHQDAEREATIVSHFSAYLHTSQLCTVQR